MSAVMCFLFIFSQCIRVCWLRPRCLWPQLCNGTLGGAGQDIDGVRISQWVGLVWESLVGLGVAAWDRACLVPGWGRLQVPRGEVLVLDVAGTGLVG